MTRDLYKLLLGVEGKAFGLLPSKIARIQINSKLVTAGDIFVAIRGNQVDGHQFVHEAVKNGAILVVAEKNFEDLDIPQLIVPDTRIALSRLAANYYGNPSSHLKVIGVTGTNGKTTTVYLVNAILKSAGIKRGTIGTLGYSIEDSSFSSNLTTPDSLQLQQILAQMVAQGVEVVVMEVSSHSLALHRVDDVHFYCGAFTNISQDHLDFHKTMEEYALAKTILFRKVNPAGFLVCNIEDDYANLFIQVASAPLYSYALKASADYTWEKEPIYLNGIKGKIKTPKTVISIESKLSGIHNLKNILCAVAITENLSIPPEAIAQGIKSVNRVPGRLEEVSKPDKPRVFIDYAHTPNAIRNVLGVVRNLLSEKGKLIVVFGCGGNRDRTKRPLMARAVAEFADLAILTSDNPRFEEPEEIIKEAEAGFPANFNYRNIVDRREAICYALQIANSEDIVAILGKGHENYQEIKGQRLPFSDRAVVLECWSKSND